MKSNLTIKCAKFTEQTQPNFRIKLCEIFGKTILPGKRAEKLGLKLMTAFKLTAVKRKFIVAKYD